MSIGCIVRKSVLIGCQQKNASQVNGGGFPEGRTRAAAVRHLGTLGRGLIFSICVCSFQGSATDISRRVHILLNVTRIFPLGGKYKVAKAQPVFSLIHGAGAVLQHACIVVLHITV